jgi:meso-butanediol dehydrogenase/(S,S)-butanediol dehydrogenase/diacetyl reductase
MPELSNRIAVVTGGASGIGRATAILLAEHGADVFIGDYSHIDKNAAIFDPLGIIALPCDVRSESDLRQLIDSAAEANGTIDILVNNAGSGMAKQISEVTEQDWADCIDTNLKGAFFACKHAIGYMAVSQGGSIINMSSNAGLLSHSQAPVYSISKSALIALTRSLALCHARDKIRVNAVCPGPVEDTRMMNAALDNAPDREATIRTCINASPLARAYDRMTSPKEIAQAVFYLASDASCMVTGTALAIDGGKSLGITPM